MKIDNVENHLTLSSDDLLANQVSIDYESSIHVKEKPEQKKSFKINLLFISVLIFTAIYTSPILEAYPTEHSCLAIVVTVLFLWSTKSTHYYVVSYLIPILSVWLQIGIDKKNGCRIPAPLFAQDFSYILMSPQIFEYLGSITMIAAVDKLGINSFMCKRFLKRIPPYPNIILFAVMISNLLLGSFLSTSSSTTFFLSLAIPIIRTLDLEDLSFAKALLLGIAWSSNCSSIPTIRMANDLPLSIMEYIIFSLPCAIILCIAEFYFIMKVYKFPKNKIMLTKIKRKNNQNEENWSSKNWGFDHYLTITVFTLCLFLNYFAYFLDFVGHEGIMALIPIIILCGAGILTTNDFNMMNWSTISLAGGGLVLNEAMKSSGLFNLMFNTIFERLNGLTEWSAIVMYSIVTSFLSSIYNDKMFFVDKIMGLWSGSTIIITVPVLMIHVAQLFISSTFANTMVTSIVDSRTNEPIITGSEYVKYGLFSTVIAVIIFSTVGYYLAHSLGL